MDGEMELNKVIEIGVNDLRLDMRNFRIDPAGAEPVIKPN